MLLKFVSTAKSRLPKLAILVRSTLFFVLPLCPHKSFSGEEKQQQHKQASYYWLSKFWSLTKTVKSSTVKKYLLNRCRTNKTELSVLHKTFPSAAFKVFSICWVSGAWMPDSFSARSIFRDSGVHGTNNSPSRQRSLEDTGPSVTLLFPASVQTTAIPYIHAK